MPSLAAVRATNVSFEPPFIPPAVFVGATSSIGQATVVTFARWTNENDNVVITGHNREPADRIISSFPKRTSTDVKRQFIPCDTSPREECR